MIRGAAGSCVFVGVCSRHSSSEQQFNLIFGLFFLSIEANFPHAV